MIYALKDGDGDALYRATIQAERNCSNLSPFVIRQAWGLLVGPHIQSSKFLGVESGKLQSNQVQATAALKFLDKYGNPWRMTAIMNQTADGPRAQIIYRMLVIASLFDETGRVSSVLTPELTLKGIERYRTQLEGLGIRSVMLTPGSCLSWDELQAKLHRGIDGRKSAAQR